jgi:RHS repeat-associated protein
VSLRLGEAVQRKRISYCSSKVAVRGVDGLGRVTNVTVDGSAIANWITYHANGSVAGVTYGNGQVFSQTLTPRQQTDRLRSVKGAELPVDLTYTYTPRSQIASINDQSVPNIDQAFTYDGIGRLTASTGPWGAGAFQYDGLGNIRQRSVGTRTVGMSYDASNRLSSHTDTAGAARSLTYDNRGNVTALGRLSFVYDASDQPVQTLDGGPPPGTVPASDGVIFDGTVPRVQKRAATVLAPVTVAMSAAYDGHMRRVKSVAGLTRYSVYDASGTLIEIDEVGGAKTDYIRASGMTLARIAGSTVTWLHHDHLGSAVAGTNSAGAVGPSGPSSPRIDPPGQFVCLRQTGCEGRESEQPFGEDWTSAAANDNQAGYTGHVEDAATGLTYMQARYYDPVIGRFLSIDPVGFSPGRPDMFNRYAYAANDPVNAWDPGGAKIAFAGDDDYVKEVTEELEEIANGSEEGAAVVTALMENENTVVFVQPGAVPELEKQLSDQGHSLEVVNTIGQSGADNHNGRGGDTFVLWGPSMSKGGSDDQGSRTRPAGIGLAHELPHALADLTGKGRDPSKPYLRLPNTTPDFEKDSLRLENIERARRGLPPRSFYFQELE